MAKNRAAYDTRIREAEAHRAEVTARIAKRAKPAASVMAAATYLGAYGAYDSGVHIASGGNHPYSYYCCASGSAGVAGTASNSTVFTARLLDLYYDGLSL